jgi:predicted metallopeptidase
MSPILQCYAEHQFKVLNELGLYIKPKVADKIKVPRKKRLPEKERFKILIRELKHGPSLIQAIADKHGMNTSTLNKDLAKLAKLEKVSSVVVKTGVGRYAKKWSLHETN